MGVLKPVFMRLVSPYIVDLMFVPKVDMSRFLFLFFLLGYLHVSAQSIIPFTINSGGAQTKASFSLDYSIGESASIAFFQNSSQFSLNTGFIQSFTPLSSGIVLQVFDEGEGLTLSPNPANRVIRLKGIISRPGFFEFHIIDSQGRILETYPSTYYINYLDKEMSVSQLIEGTYFMRLIYSSPEGGNQSTSFKFIKLN